MYVGYTLIPDGCCKMKQTYAYIVLIYFKFQTIIMTVTQGLFKNKRTIRLDQYNRCKTSVEPMKVVSLAHFEKKDI